MRTNQELLKTFEDYFDKKNGHIIYRDPETGKLKVDYSKLPKEDNRNFVPLTKAILKGLPILNKAEHIGGAGYQVWIVGGPNITPFDVKSVKSRLLSKASVTDNLSHTNRDRTEITIRFFKEDK